MAFARRLLLLSIPMLAIIAIAAWASGPAPSEATGDGSPVACEAENVTGTVNLSSDNTANAVLLNTSEINMICVQVDGLDPFPISGAGDCRNSVTDTDTSSHSPCITSNGTYGVDTCGITVLGLGTQTVQVILVDLATGGLCGAATLDHIDYRDKTFPLPPPSGDCLPPGPNESALAHCANTIATVGGSSGGAPVVENKWELPDMDPVAAGIQYEATMTGTDPCVWNATNTQYINTPCIDDNGNDIADSNTGEFGHYHHDADPCKAGDVGCQLTVTPNVDDKPEKRAIEIWAIVSDAVGGVGDVASVQAVVSYLPAGCPAGATGAAGVVCDPVKKVTTPTHPVQLVKRSCDELFGPEPPEPAKGETDPESPIHAAVNTGQLQHGKLTQENCLQHEWDAYAGYFLLNNDQPWGKYQVCVQAIDTSSNLGERCNTLFVQNVVAFKIDFASVDFGAISAGVSKTVSPGDMTNTGNADACLSVLFGEMVGKNNQGAIDEFGAELKGEALAASADIPVQFATVIPSKVQNKVEFTINPPSPLAPDTYQGRVDLSVKKCGGMT